MEENILRFNLRVYGILENEKEEILLCREKIKNFRFTKFPGGGLELGEGISDCLIREFDEELSLKIEVKDHFYTTDFFQRSAFISSDQLISFYYRVTALEEVRTEVLNDFAAADKECDDKEISFFWVPKSKLLTELLTFPVDKHVASLLKNQHA